MPRIRKNDDTLYKSKIRIWKAGLYVRLSKEDGNDVSLSVTNQKKLLTNYCNEHDDEIIISDIYVDDGFTGTDSDRVDFQKMLNAIKEREIDCVIVKDLSRLSRNYIEAGNYIEQLFVSLGVRFISLQLPALDSYKNPEQVNSIIVPIQNVINDDFCRQTSLKIRSTFDMKRKNGEFIGAFAPYGYVKNPDDKHKFSIDEEVAPIVKDIFYSYVNNGMSKRSIAFKLNELGIPNPTAYKKQKGMKYKNPNHEINDGLWSALTVDMILKNQSYIGDMVQGRNRIKSYKVHEQISVPKDEWFIVPKTHEPIITDDMFHKAQQLMKRDTRVGTKSKINYLFSGFIHCADCGKAMHRDRAGKYVYYFCSTYTRKSKTKCTKHTIREDNLEKVILHEIQKEIAIVSSLTDMIEEINQAPTINTQCVRLEETLNTKKIEYKKIEKKSDGLYDDWKNGDITHTDYRRLKEKYEEQIHQLKNVISNLECEINETKKGVDNENPYLKSFLKYRNITILERSIVVELIENISIHEDGMIEITFQFQDQYQNILNFIQNNKKQLEEQ